MWSTQQVCGMELGLETYKLWVFASRSFWRMPWTLSHFAWFFSSNFFLLFFAFYATKFALGTTPTKLATSEILHHSQETYHTYEVFHHTHTPTNHLHYLNPIDLQVAFPHHINGVIDESGIFMPLIQDGNLMRHAEISYDPYGMTAMEINETHTSYQNGSHVTEVGDQQPSCSSTPNNTGSTPSTSSSGKSTGASSKKRGCFPKNATNKLKHWLFQNLTVRWREKFFCWKSLY